MKGVIPQCLNEMVVKKFGESKWENILKESGLPENRLFFSHQEIDDNIKDAFERLESEEVVLGLCEDGGYYLIGLNESMPSLFKDIPWSTPRVTEVTLARASEQCVIISMLDKWYNVDTYKDLLQLKNDLDSDSKLKLGAYLCKNTYQFLSEILL